jgi:hypothetical protein
MSSILTVQRDYNQIFSSTQAPPPRFPPRQKTGFFTRVISDVDDTLKSSGGVNVAGVTLGGIDVQYPCGDFYPSIAEFMLEISWYGK